MNLAKYIDATILSADATAAQIQRLCSEAKELNVKSVCVNPRFIALAKTLLRGSDVLVCTVVDFPLGASIANAKAKETAECVLAGADEIDMVANPALLRENPEEYTLSISAVRNACQGKTLKVIIETCYLSPEEIALATKLVIGAGADFVKTSTGFGTRGASVSDIMVMQTVKERLDSNIGIKASGGIRDAAFAAELIAAGATRIGTSKHREILNG